MFTRVLHALQPSVERVDVKSVVSWLAMESSPVGASKDVFCQSALD